MQIILKSILISTAMYLVKKRFFSLGISPPRSPPPHPIYKPPLILVGPEPGPFDMQ